MAMSAEGKKKSSSSLLAPGFRFHPTDEELVRYYLRRKICGKGFRFDAISDIDIYKVEPWDLPSFSKLKTRDLEWYFFSMLDKKYGNGARTNRATEKGYWKTTGKDRAVYHKSQIVGMKKTLVFHIGRAPKGQRSNWVMHEYRLADLELERAGIVQDAFVLCRVFQKSGSGPKNGEQYGAPFVDEEWEEDLELFPKAEVAEEVDFGDVYLDGDDLEQILGSDVPSDASPLPLLSQSADGKLVEETAESVIDNSQQLLLTASEQNCELEQHHEDENLYALHAPYEMDVRAVKREYIGESSKSRDPDDLDYLLDQPFVDAPDGLPYGNVGFLEANDLTNPVEMNSSAFDMLEEYLTYFDATDSNLEQFAFDPSLMLGSEDLIFDQALLQTEELLNDGTEQASLQNGQLVNDNNEDTAWPSDKLDSVKYESDVEYPFISTHSHLTFCRANINMADRGGERAPAGERGGFGRGFGGDRGGRGLRGDRGRGRGGRRPRRDTEEQKWVPVTKLGRLVRDGKIQSLEQIYLHSLPIKEYQIIDTLVGPSLKDEVMKIMPVQKQTRAGQRTRFKAFVVVGDTNGHVGLGVKCSKEVATAIRGAIILAKLSVIPVRRGYWGNKIGKPHTVPCKVTGKCGSVTVRMVPAPRGAGIVAARVPKKVLQFAGIEDVFTSSRGSTKTLGNFVKATFECLLKTYGFLTPDFWKETRFTRSPYQEFTDLLARPTTKIAAAPGDEPENAA